MTGLVLVDAVLVLGALITAVYTIWKKAVVPCIRFGQGAARAHAQLNVVYELSHQLKNDLDSHCEWSREWQGIVDHEFAELWKAFGLSRVSDETILKAVEEQ